MATKQEDTKAEKRTPPAISSDNNKFRFTGKSRRIGETVVWQIAARKRLVDPITRMYISKGEKGGYIEREDNLGYKNGDTSWIFDGCAVMGTANVEGNSSICCHVIPRKAGEPASRYGCTVVDAKIIDNARVYGVDIKAPTIISGNACIRRRADVPVQMRR